ncbi:hypothetical protein CAC42_2068 [Sphaceloma murrayae]|uniref:Rhodopsin domain-containing protein n=1 Tax=Sphaceloma murrayae TaxID=2082308 RepID=A0A2K1QIW8_9PEZI|nr:hypothetical protein CAC42_2068 [Sphaceloma murrayae]
MSLTGILEGLKQLSAISTACLVITTIAVALRLYTRARILRKVDWDDYAMIASYLFFVATCVITLEVSKNIDDLFRGRRLNMKQLTTLVMADACLYICSMLMLKLSLGFFFLRIFVVHVPQRMIIYSIIIASTLMSLAYLFFTTLSCGLIHGFFPVHQECDSSTIYSIYSISWSSFNAFTDMTFVGISVHALWIANLPCRTKICASAVLVFGCLGGIASIVRIVILTTGSVGPAAFSMGVHSGHWTLVEDGLGITAASLACLRPLLRLLRNKLHPTSSRTGLTQPETTNALTEDNHSSKGFSRKLTGLPSALTAQGSRAPQIRDWREDRITTDMEFCSPNAAIMGSVFTMEERSMVDSRPRSLQTHNLL